SRAATDATWELVDRSGRRIAADEVPAMRALRTGQVIRNQVVGLRDGRDEHRWLQVNAQPFTVDQNKTRIVVTFTDITAQELARRDAESTSELLSTIVETIPDAVAAYDAEGRLVFFNAALSALYSKSADAIRLGARLEDILRAGLANGQYPAAGDTIEEQEAWLARRLALHKSPPETPVLQHLDDGRWLQIRERVSKSGLIVGIRSDITALKAAENRVRVAAERDALTGLVNRKTFAERMEATLETLQAGDGSGAVVVLDIDNFKDVNDTLGHNGGDAFLQEVATRLTENCRAGDTIARLGGDEFALLLPPEVYSRSLALSTVSAIVERVCAPLDIAGRRLYPKMSAGVVLYPDDGRTAADLLKNADVAIYARQHEGRNGVSLYDPALKQQLSRRSELSARLREAIANDQVDVAFQAQVNLHTGEHVAFEALARWCLDGTMISPSEFVPIAEEFSMAKELDRLILRKSAALLARLKARGYEPGRVAINLSTDTLGDPLLVTTVGSVLEPHGITFNDLEIEVTECVVIERSHEKIRANLAETRERGALVALDDFGTGYASLRHLKTLRVDTLKIDQTFVRGVLRDRGDATIVKAIINIARSLNIGVVAEGIESERQALFLASQGCRIGQGYLFHKPESDIEELVRHLDGWRWNR
ncbi:MAG: EAL domain-containing protein, partial [Rubellimicrobium sp.]|nr:EAL domain-containing protein [Rubellimicrobium sp.]